MWLAALVEKNIGVVHTGINVPAGSVKAKYNVAGAKMFERYCADCAAYCYDLDACRWR